MISIISWNRSKIHLHNKLDRKRQLPWSCFAFTCITGQNKATKPLSVHKIAKNSHIWKLPSLNALQAQYWIKLCTSCMPMDCGSVDPLLIPVCKKILWQQNIFRIGVMSSSDIRHVFTMGCPRKKIHTLPPPPRQKGFWKFLQEGRGGGGSKTLETQTGGGLN